MGRAGIPESGAPADGKGGSPELSEDTDGADGGNPAVAELSPGKGGKPAEELLSAPGNGGAVFSPGLTGWSSVPLPGVSGKGAIPVAPGGGFTGVNPPVEELSMGKGGRVLVELVLAVPLSGKGGIVPLAAIVEVFDSSLGNGGRGVCPPAPTFGAVGTLDLPLALAAKLADFRNRFISG